MTNLVRLDISGEIGTGHFRRMLNLSQYMSNDEFIFIIKTDNTSNKIFNQLNIMFISDENEFHHILQTLTYDAILIDLLHYTPSYVKNIKKISKTPIISFHEYTDFTEDSDIIINYNFLDNYNYPKLSNRLLLGPKYMIFDDDIEHYSDAQKLDYIFVSFGGSDPTNFTIKFIEDIASELSSIKFKIHLGNFNIGNYPKKANIEYLQSPTNIFKHMAEAKIAVSAGGNMMYELIFLHTPAIILAHNAHQEKFAKNAEQLKCVKYLSLISEYNKKNLLHAINELFFGMAHSCHGIINNEGKKLISNTIHELFT